MKIVKQPPTFMLFCSCLAAILSILVILFIKGWSNKIGCFIILTPLNYTFWWCLLSSTSYIESTESVTLNKNPNGKEKRIITALEASKTALVKSKEYDIWRLSNIENYFNEVMETIINHSNIGCYNSAFSNLSSYPEVQKKLIELGFSINEYKRENGEIWMSVSW